MGAQTHDPSRWLQTVFVISWTGTSSCLNAAITLGLAVTVAARNWLSALLAALVIFIASGVRHPHTLQDRFFRAMYASLCGCGPFFLQMSCRMYAKDQECGCATMWLWALCGVLCMQSIAPTHVRGGLEATCRARDILNQCGLRQVGMATVADMGGRHLDVAERPKTFCRSQHQKGSMPGFMVDRPKTNALQHDRSVDGTGAPVFFISHTQRRICTKTVHEECIESTRQAVRRQKHVVPVRTPLADANRNGAPKAQCPKACPVFDKFAFEGTGNGGHISKSKEDASLHAFPIASSQGVMWTGMHIPKMVLKSLQCLVCCRAYGRTISQTHAETGASGAYIANKEDPCKVWNPPRCRDLAPRTGWSQPARCESVTARVSVETRISQIPGKENSQCSGRMGSSEQSDRQSGNHMHEVTEKFGHVCGKKQGKSHAAQSSKSSGRGKSLRHPFCAQNENNCMDGLKDAKKDAHRTDVPKRG
mmetsp:Transcript_47925/g.111973  ORF Transcript_47925/g.111973 Transcript_47925/m.111973 type:complete len:477 (+) Transcript_47925:36-1466(+)